MTPDVARAPRARSPELVMDRRDPGRWAELVQRSWERAPARAALPTLIADDASALPALFRATLQACEPFRAGTRFGAIPDVRFFTGDSQLRAPGPLLPRAADRSLLRYVQRVRAQLHPDGFQLLVSHPQVLSGALWMSLHQVLAALCARVGVPVLPVACELLVGQWRRTPRAKVVRPHRAALTLVLAGELTVGGPATTGARGAARSTLTARAGQLVYWPARQAGAAGQRVERPLLDASPTGCVALRLWLPVHGSRLPDALKELVTQMVDRELADHEAVHYLTYPPPVHATRGHLADAPPLQRAARQVHRVARSAELRRAAQITWARRVSACGLEPAAAPLPAAPLAGGDTLSVLATPVQLAMGQGLAVWAVNGHAFTVPDGRAARRLWAALSAGPPRTVRALLGEAKARGEALPPRQAVELLQTLVQLRALAVTPGRRAAGRQARRAPARRRA